MAIQQLVLAYDEPNIVFKGGRDLDVFVDGEYAGYIIADRYRNITKKTFLKKWDNEASLVKLMEVVPETYRFNYYWLDHLKLSRPFRGRGLGQQVLEKWFGTLQHPACAMLLPAKTDGVPVDSLVRFYKKAGFKIVSIDGMAYAITFIKAK